MGERMTASMREGSPRLTGPRMHPDGTLKERAIARTMSAPACNRSTMSSFASAPARNHSSRNSFATARTLHDSFESLGSPTSPTSPAGTYDYSFNSSLSPKGDERRATLGKPVGIGKWKYVPPP